MTKPLEQYRVTLSGTQPELEAMFAERYARLVRMNRARIERKLKRKAAKA